MGFCQAALSEQGQRIRPIGTHGADVGDTKGNKDGVLGMTKESEKEEEEEEKEEEGEEKEEEDSVDDLSFFKSEAQPALKSPNPITPTSAEMEQHNLTHLPYRNWCPVCVKAKCRETQHGSAPRSTAGRGIPQI